MLIPSATTMTFLAGNGRVQEGPTLTEGLLRPAPASRVSLISELALRPAFGQQCWRERLGVLLERGSEVARPSRSTLTGRRPNQIPPREPRLVLIRGSQVRALPGQLRGWRKSVSPGP